MPSLHENQHLATKGTQVNWQTPVSFALRYCIKKRAAYLFIVKIFMTMLTCKMSANMQNSHKETQHHHKETQNHNKDIKLPQ